MSTIEVIRPTMLSRFGPISVRDYVKNLNRHENAPPHSHPRRFPIKAYRVPTNHVMVLTWQFAEIAGEPMIANYVLRPDGEDQVYEYRNSFGWSWYWYMPRVEVVSDEVYESDQEDDSQ
jgi:hypothetical protein